MKKQYIKPNTDIIKLDSDIYTSNVVNGSNGTEKSNMNDEGWQH